MMINFTRKEVKSYSDNSVDDANLEKLTNFNPYLVFLYTKVNRSGFSGPAGSCMTKHIKSIFDDIGKLSKFCAEQLELLYKWGCKAENEEKCDINSLEVFKAMWRSTQMFFTTGG